MPDADRAFRMMFQILVQINRRGRAQAAESGVGPSDKAIHVRWDDAAKPQVENLLERLLQGRQARTAEREAVADQLNEELAPAIEGHVAGDQK